MKLSELRLLGPRPEEVPIEVKDYMRGFDPDSKELRGFEYSDCRFIVTGSGDVLARVGEGAVMIGVLETVGPDELWKILYPFLVAAVAAREGSGFGEQVPQ